MHHIINIGKGGRAEGPIYCVSAYQIMLKLEFFPRVLSKIEGFIGELYEGVLRMERELAVLSRAHCCEINVWKVNLSKVAFYEIPVTTSKQTIDLYISIKW